MWNPNTPLINHIEPRDGNGSGYGWMYLIHHPIHEIFGSTRSIHHPLNLSSISDPSVIRGYTGGSGEISGWIISYIFLALALKIRKNHFRIMNLQHLILNMSKYKTRIN